MSSGRTGRWQDGRIIAFREHPLFGDSEPEDNFVLPHGMTWGEFKALRAPRPVSHGKDGQMAPKKRRRRQRERSAA